MILSHQSIRKYKPLEPLKERTIHAGVSYGLGPASYDVRAKQLVVLPPGESCLASTIENFNMPSDLLGVVHDKSTWARKFVAVQNTIIDPGFRGHLTLELTNHSQLIVVIHPGMGIAQIVFHMLDEPTDRPYFGKYQDQEDAPVPARYEN